jgi:hypothetical protein
MPRGAYSIDHNISTQAETGFVNTAQRGHIDVLAQLTLSSAKYAHRILFGKLQEKRLLGIP